MASRIGNYVRQHHLALLCLFLIVGGGTAWALERNSVRSKHIKNGQVSQADLRSPEDWDIVGDVDGPAFNDEGGGCDPWANWDGTIANTAGFFRDPFGIVHLRGRMDSGGNPCETVFTLPAGYRPGNGEMQIAASELGPFVPARIHIEADGAVRVVEGGTAELSLDGITFRCAPAGQNGCP